MASTAGGKASDIGTFDPFKMTLGEFVTEYIKKAKGKTGSELSEGRKESFNRIFFSETFNVKTEENWKKKGKGIPFKTIRNPFLLFKDMSMADFYAEASSSSDTNPLIHLWEKVGFPKDHVMSRSQLKEIYTAMAALDSNMKKMSVRPEYINVLSHYDMRETVTDPGKGTRYGVRYGYNPDKMSLWYLRVMEAVKNDPSKIGLGRAALALAETGFRPSMILDMPVGAYRPSEGVDIRTNLVKPSSVFLSPKIEGVKMGEKVIVPISNQLDAIMQGAWDSIVKISEGGQEIVTGRLDKEGKPIPHMFVHPNGNPITSVQLGNFIKSIKVHGIMEDFEDLNEDGSPKLLDHFLAGSVETRRMLATDMEAQGFSREQIARATGRNLVSIGGGSTGVYVSLGTGSMTEELAKPTKTIADLRWSGWNRILQQEGVVFSDKAWHPNMDMLGALTKQYGSLNPDNIFIDVDENMISAGLSQGYLHEPRTLTHIQAILPPQYSADIPSDAIISGNPKNMSSKLANIVKKASNKKSEILTGILGTGALTYGMMEDALATVKDIGIDVAGEAALKTLGAKTLGKVIPFSEFVRPSVIEPDHLAKSPEQIALEDTEMITDQEVQRTPEEIIADDTNFLNMEETNARQ